MRAMALQRPAAPLEPLSRPELPAPAAGEVVLDVHACGVCRTDLHIRDGELPAPRLPLVPGHQVVATVRAAGTAAELGPGARVGVPWLAWACGECPQCRSGRENLCPRAQFTGLHRDGGYASAMVADARFCLPLAAGIPDRQAAPLLCGGLIGHRALRRAGDGERVGLYGFGSAAHIVCQVALWEGRRVFAFTSPGDEPTQAFALELGAAWAGDSDALPPEQLDAAIVFAPVGALVPAALRALAPGGTVVCAGIRMSDIPAFPYELLWPERTVTAVANLTRRDGHEFLAVADQAGIRTHVTTYALEAANDALEDLRAGRFRGSAVLVP